MLFIAIFLVIIAATVGILYVLNVGKSTDALRGVKPTDSQVFSKVDEVKSLPAFSELPNETSGWKKTSSLSESAYSNTQLTNDSSCTIDISAQLLPNTQKDVKDFELSRSLVDTIALSEEGSATDPYVIPVRSTNGDVDFYSALYNPKLQLIHSTGTTPTTQGGSKKRDGAFSTYMAARVFGNRVQVGEESTESTVEKGVVSLGAMLPVVVYSYTCPTDRFDVSDAVKHLKQVKIDFKKTTTIVPATSGK